MILNSDQELLSLSLNKKFELYFFERFSSYKKPILCLLFEYFLPGFPNPIKNISFIIYIKSLFIENYKIYKQNIAKQTETKNQKLSGIN